MTKNTLFSKELESVTLLKRELTTKGVTFHFLFGQAETLYKKRKEKYKSEKNIFWKFI